jgi:hypothetical protein
MTIEVSSDWEMVNKLTGEVRSLISFEDKMEKGRWEKVYAKSLCDMLDITGDEKTQVIAYMIKNKDYENRVMETVRSIAANTKVSAKTVNRTLLLLQKHNYLHKVRNGLWRFSPHVMVNGKSMVGAAVFRSWETENE